MPARVKKVVVEKTGVFENSISGLRVLALGLKYLLRPDKRFTLVYPEERLAHEEGFRGYIILNLEKCIGCRSCERVCPASAVKMVAVEPEKGKKQAPLFNYQRCIFCGFCVDVCPVDALSHSSRMDQVFEKLEDMVVEPGSSPLRGGDEGALSYLILDERYGLVKVRR